MLTIQIPRKMRRENEAVVAPLRWREAASRVLLAAAVLLLAGGGLGLLLAIAYRDGAAPSVAALPLAAVTAAAGLWLTRTLARVRTPVRFKVHHGSLHVTGPGATGLLGPRVRQIPLSAVSGVSVAGGQLRVHRRRRPAVRVARSPDAAELERVAAVLRSALRLDVAPSRRHAERTTATVV